MFIFGKISTILVLFFWYLVKRAKVLVVGLACKPIINHRKVGGVKTLHAGSIYLSMNVLHVISQKLLFHFLCFIVEYVFDKLYNFSCWNNRSCSMVPRHSMVYRSLVTWHKYILLYANKNHIILKSPKPKKELLLPKFFLLLLPEGDRMWSEIYIIEFLGRLLIQCVVETYKRTLKTFLVL